MSREVEYLIGHKVNSDGIHPTADKIKAIQDAPKVTESSNPSLGFSVTTASFSQHVNNLSPIICAAPKEQEVEMGKGTTRSF